MGLKQVLRKLKLVELEESAPGGRAPERLEEILASVEPAPPIDERRLPAAARPTSASLSFPQFSEVYAAAGITEPAHGFSAFKVLEILEAPEFGALEPRAKAAALLGFLKRNPGGAVEIADVVSDAVRRDQALDKFEEFLRVKLAERIAAADAENGALQSEIDELARRNRERIDSNRQAVEEQRRRLDAWLEAKRTEERRLAAAVEPFVEKSPIST